MGRKKIDIDIKEAEHLAGLGLTEEEIALNLGVSVDTLGRRKKDTADFAESIARGKARTKRNIGNKVYEKAMDGDSSMLKWFEQSRFGYSEKQAIDHSGKLEIEYVNDWRNR
jgi:hypothetical protein